MDKSMWGLTNEVAWSGDKLDQEGGAHREAVGEAGRGTGDQGDIVGDPGLIGADDHLGLCVDTDPASIYKLGLARLDHRIPLQTWRRRSTGGPYYQ